MKTLTGIYSYLNDLFKLRGTIFELAKRDFKVRYLGSYLGILWAFIQPVIYTLMLWFIFQLGFKSTPVEHIPYILWLLPGLIVWFFFSESLMNATTAIIEHSYLVKKIAFRAGMLLLMKILSSLFVHLVFVGILFLALCFYGKFANPFALQTLYYLFAGIFFVMGLSFITSSLSVFVRDVGPVLGVILNFGFWLTPIFWNIQMVPEKHRWLMKLNPVYYLVSGYRKSFIYQTALWDDPLWTLYFWGVTIVVFFVGIFLFHTLRPHFADVL